MKKHIEKYSNCWKCHQCFLSLTMNLHLEKCRSQNYTTKKSDEVTCVEDDKQDDRMHVKDQLEDEVLYIEDNIKELSPILYVSNVEKHEDDILRGPKMHQSSLVLIKCDECDKTFKHNMQLKAHNRKHSKD